MELNKILVEMNVKLDRIDSTIDKIVNPSNWIGVKEAAQWSGLSVSPLRRAVRVGSLRCSRRLGKLLFKRSEIDRWLCD